MAAYSFLDVTLSINGPNISATIGGDGTGSAEEGFSVIYEEDADVMTPGASGDVMHSLTANKRGRIELHLLKTSPINALISHSYTADRSFGSTEWGQNEVVVRNPVSGDTYHATRGAWRKFADNAYQVRGNIMVWTLNCSQIDPALGALTIQ